MIRQPAADDFAAMVALNNASAVETSLLTLVSMQCLVATAFYTRVAGNIDALCIALEQDAVYDSPNFHWFRGRFDRFVYIDRIIVASHARQHGLARMLYGDLVSAARHARHTLLACEVNVSPPNPASDYFHHVFGFIEVGQALLADRGKTVRYLVLRI